MIHLTTGRTLGWKLAEGKVTLGGSGGFNLSFTHCADITHYLAYVLNQSSPSKLAWKILQICI